MCGGMMQRDPVKGIRAAEKWICANYDQWKSRVEAGRLRRQRIDASKLAQALRRRHRVGGRNDPA
jgi:hypothetical protein